MSDTIFFGKVHRGLFSPNFSKKLTVLLLKKITKEGETHTTEEQYVVSEIRS